MKLNSLSLILLCKIKCTNIFHLYWWNLLTYNNLSEDYISKARDEWKWNYPSDFISRFLCRINKEKFVNKCLEKKWLCINFLETKQQHIRLSISASFHLSLDSTKFNHYRYSLYKTLISIFCCEDAIIFRTPHRADMKSWQILAQIHNQPKRLFL